MIETPPEPPMETEAPNLLDHAETDATRAPKGKHAKGLVAIGLFKLGKAIFFFALGMGALHLVHKNLGDMLLRLENVLHFDPEGEFAGMLQDKVDLISGHQLRQVSIASVGYSLISLTEGIGLLMEQTWAEYLTLILTTLALPIELFEIIKRPTGMRFGVLGMNLVVLAYLLWFVRSQRREAQASEFERS